MTGHIVGPDTMVCPECGAPLALKETAKYPQKDGSPGKFWGCEKWRETGCKGAVGAHPDGSPMGTPADAYTRGNRIAAHEVFDAFWKRNGWSRKRGYRWMREAMGLSKEDAHIAMFDSAQCGRLIRKCSGFE